MTKEELYYLPASELLKHIHTEKERLIKEKVIKKSKPLPPITDEEKPYDLPEGWAWVRLDDCFTHIKNGATIKQDKSLGGIPITRIETIANYSVDREKMGYAGIQEIDKYLNYVLEDLDILMSHINSVKYVGKCALYKKNEDEIIIHGMNLLSLRCNQLYLNPYYAYYYFNSIIFINSIQNIIKRAVNQASMSITDLKMKLIPLPPLYIQDQIVQKLEQISETKDYLLSHAEYQFTYTKRMREALLQEMIRGELVTQNEHDEPASILLEKIKTEKERLIKEKVIKKSKPLPPITDEEKPYELPSGWEWAKLGEIGYSTIGLTYSPKDVCSSGITILRSNNVKEGKINLINTISVDKIVKENLILKENDILLCSRNGSKALVGKGAIIKDIGIGMSFGAFMTVYRSICNPYINYFIQSDFFRNQLEKCGTTTINQLTQDILLNIIIPLPPLSEQERIVAKLDELMTNCDQLEAKAEEMKNYTIKLFESSLKEVFMPE